MKYWYDTEFDEQGERIIPISIAFTSEDNRDLYLINREYVIAHFTGEEYLWKNKYKFEPNDFVQKNVLDKISIRDLETYGTHHYEWARKIYNYLTNEGRVGEIELWGHFAAYDHIVYSQAFGRMIDLPAPLPMFTNDDMTIRNGQNAPPRPKHLREHHALDDAKYQKFQYEVWMGGTNIGFN